MRYLFIFSLITSTISFITAQNQPGLHVEQNYTVLFGQDTTSGGTKVLWYPSKAAFRAGKSNTTEWIQENVGTFSAAFGTDTEARGIYSSAFGLSTWALSFGETSVGRYSQAGGNPSSWVDTDPLFEVGNGSSSGNRSNAFTVYKNGNAEVQHSMQLGDHVGATPAAGTIQYNSNTMDYEAWDSQNNQWESLTSSSGMAGTVTDIDGNVYLTVQIGTQTWMKENLRTTRYREGTPIAQVTINSQWEANDGTGKWKWYDNNEDFDMPYGKFYNWYAADDSRGLCPSGWHVPSLSEANQLASFLGGISAAGVKMVIPNSVLWSTNPNATNSSGFTAIAGGNITEDGRSVQRTIWATFHLSTEANINASYRITLNGNTTNLLQIGVSSGTVNKKVGRNVRCLMN